MLYLIHEEEGKFCVIKVENDENDVVGDEHDVDKKDSGK